LKRRFRHDIVSDLKTGLIERRERYYNASNLWPGPITEALGLHENEVIKYLETLSAAGELTAEQFDGGTYYHRQE